MPDTHPALRTLLGADAPPSVAALDAATQSDLAEVITDARRRQAASLQQAFEATLRHVPFALRGIVRKVVL